MRLVPRSLQSRVDAIFLSIDRALKFVLYNFQVLGFALHSPIERFVFAATRSRELVNNLAENVLASLESVICCLVPLFLHELFFLFYLFNVASVPLVLRVDTLRTTLRYQFSLVGE